MRHLGEGKVVQQVVEKVYADIRETLAIAQVPPVLERMGRDPEALSATWERVKALVGDRSGRSPNQQVIVAGMSVTNYN